MNVQDEDYSANARFYRGKRRLWGSFEKCSGGDLKHPRLQSKWRGFCPFIPILYRFHQKPERKMTGKMDFYLVLSSEHALPGFDAAR
jgi:hypothetical protein